MTRTIKASEFKAKCLKLIDEVAQSGEALVITKRGKPLVRVERQAPAKPKSLFGCLKGQIEIVDPNDDLTTWDREVEKDFEDRLQRTADLIAPPKRRKRVR
jgi:antitoxin (DNA-binding transcriptional repressor) of toxin-antitoxin stability system